MLYGTQWKGECIMQKIRPPPEIKKLSNTKTKINYGGI
jgi:hypothetical protein